MTTSGHKRLGREAAFELPSFGNEPICFESTNCPDDILYSGSEDEYYESPSARSRRYEDQAQQFLEGRQPFLLSASLKGPFGKDSGWDNPWKGKGGRALGSQPRRLRGWESSPFTHDVSNMPTAPQGEVALRRVDARSPNDTESDIWHSSTTKMDTTTNAPNRGWLRRRNLKRMNPIDADVFAVSPTTTMHRNKSRKLANSVRCVSLPLEASGNRGHVEGDLSRQGNYPELQNPSYKKKLATPSQAGSSLRTTSKLRDFTPLGKSPRDDQLPGQWDTSLSSQKMGNKANIVNNKEAATIALQNCESALRAYTNYGSGPSQPQTAATAAANQLVSVANAPFRSNNISITSSSVGENKDLDDDAAVPDSLGITTGKLVKQPEVTIVFLGDMAPLSFDEIDTAECDVVMRNIHDEGQDCLGGAVSEESAEWQWQSSLSNVTDGVTRPPCHQSPIPLSNTANNNIEKSNVSDVPEEEEYVIDLGSQSEKIDVAVTEESRMATQDQSPWTQSPFTLPSTPRKATVGVREVQAEGLPDLNRVEAGPNHLRVNENILETVISIQTQSPWLEKPSFGPNIISPAHQAPDAINGDGSSRPAETSNDMRVSLEQNPWAEASHTEASLTSSQPKLPTLPNSPSSPSFLSQTTCEQRQEVSMPDPSTTSRLSPLNTTPSTPETKQSSLPTPDLTVSIKSFKRFRSPTPTPPPRQRTRQSGGLKSVLLPPRSRRDARSGHPDRRVTFVLPEQEDASGLPFTYIYDVVDEEGDHDGENAPAGRNKPSKSALDIRRGGKVGGPQSHIHRATSPPPRQSVMTEALPSEVEKFQGHFATVASRCQGGPVNEKAGGWAAANSARQPHLRPTGLGNHEAAPADVFGRSPAFDTMAGSPRICKPSQRDPAAYDEQARWDGDKENSWDQLASAESLLARHEPNEGAVDDVQEVLENLGDFLGVWDVDTELSRVKPSGL